MTPAQIRALTIGAQVLNAEARRNRDRMLGPELRIDTLGAFRSLAADQEQAARELIAMIPADAEAMLLAVSQRSTAMLGIMEELLGPCELTTGKKGGGR